MKSVDTAYAAATANLSTPRLTRALQEAVEKQEPKRKGSIRPKMRYAHQGGQNPPIIVIHGNALDGITRAVQALPGKAFPRHLQPDRHPAADRTAQRQEPVRQKTPDTAFFLSAMFLNRSSTTKTLKQVTVGFGSSFTKLNVDPGT
jgi:hypothetical protein